MGNKLLISGLLLIATNTFSQINFGTEKVLIDDYQMPNFNAEIVAADLNGDSTKDLILTSGQGGFDFITVCPNIQGDFTTTQLRLVFDNTGMNEYPSGISVIDVNNDGLPDIIACNHINNRINWFRNLGNFTFSPKTLLMNVANAPNISVISDVDNDGLKDIIVSLNITHAVAWLKNNGNGTFAGPQVILSDTTFDTVKILAKDLNNDGKPEVIIGNVAEDVYWAKNLGNGAFGPKVQLASANLGIAFEFEDLNNDNFPDYICSSGTSLLKQLSQSGNTFATNTSTTISASLTTIQFKDLNHDGRTDLMGSTGNSILYLNRLANGTFASDMTIINANPVTYFVADDFNNDTFTDFIIPSYGNTVAVKKILAYMGSGATTYNEKLIIHNSGAVLTTKVADLDNDGKNDIISCISPVIWNKNKGGGDFTSYRKISNNFPDITTYDIEAADIDNDNDKDVVVTTQVGIEVYYNDGNGNFSLGYNLTLDHISRNIEVADLNGDGFKDIVMTFRNGVTSGNICLAWIPNLTGTTFGPRINLGTSVYAYEPYLLKCGDMDNDGDNDIVTYSTAYSKIHLHTNNGSGIFTYSQVAEVSAVCMTVEDYDNDGDLDIFAAGNYYPGIYLIKNTGGGIFASPSLIQNKPADNIAFADLNADGYKELIGTATETSSLGTLYYFLNNGNGGFGNQVLIGSEALYSLSRNVSLGDLDSDNKPDIVKSYYFNGKVSYFFNTSTLSIVDTDIKDNLVLYPIPFTETLSWKIPNNDLSDYEVLIFNLNGVLVYSTKETSTSSIDLSSLPKGVYLLNFKSSSKTYSRKVIKN